MVPATSPPARGLLSLRAMRAVLPFCLLVACGGDDTAAPCEDERITFRSELRCEDEFFAQAARPLDSALPGAWSTKVVFDRSDEALYFQDTERFPLHSEFAIAELGWPPGTPFFEQYLRPDRRFLLGALTYYELADVWAFELGVESRGPRAGDKRLRGRARAVSRSAAAARARRRPAASVPT